MSTVDAAQVSAAAPDTLLQLTLLRALKVRFVMSSWIAGDLVLLLNLLFAWCAIKSRNLFQKFEIDQAEVGIGQHKLKLKLKLTINEMEHQIAHRVRA